MRGFSAEIVFEFISSDSGNTIAKVVCFGKHTIGHGLEQVICIDMGGRIMASFCQIGVYFKIYKDDIVTMMRVAIMVDADIAYFNVGIALMDGIRIFVEP